MPSNIELASFNWLLVMDSRYRLNFSNGNSHATLDDVGAQRLSATRFMDRWSWNARYLKLRIRVLLSKDA